MPSLAEIYLARGRSESDAELRKAAIEAQRGTQSAALWGNTIANLANTAGTALTEYGRQKQNAPLIAAETKNRGLEGELLQGRVDDMRSGRADAALEPQRQQTAMSILAQSRTQDPTTGAPMIDQAKLLEGLTAAGMADRYKTLQPIVESYQKNATDASTKQAAAMKDMAGIVADGGYHPEDFAMGIDDLVQRGLMSENAAMPLLKRAKEDPNFVKNFTMRVTGQQPDKPVVVGKDSALVSPTGQELYRGKPGEPDALELQKQKEVERHNKEMERLSGRGATAPVSVLGPDGKPIYVSPQDALGKTPASNREQGRPVTSGDAGRLADFDTSLNDLATLRGTIPAGTTGPMAEAGAALPNFVTAWTGIGANAKEKQAVIDRVKQVIGKALEGGVLRKEDEYKYTKILPTIGDVDSVVKSKLDGLEKAITQRRSTELENLADAGYDTSRFQARIGGQSQPQKETVDLTIPKRPAGVPANATWDPVTKRWKG